METMETFSLDPRRWRVGWLFSRNPLLRRLDRLELIVFVFAVAISLLALPVAAAKGTDVYQARRALYAEEARGRHVEPVSPPATSSSGLAPTDQPQDPPPSAKSIAWDDNADQSWVDDAGKAVSLPPPLSRAAFDAVETAVVIECLIVGTMAGLVVGTRWQLGRRRDAQWNSELAKVFGDVGRDQA